MHKDIEYRLRMSKKARSLRLTIYHDGELVVTAPFKMKMGTIEKFIVKKAKWILEKLEFFKSIPKTSFLRTHSREAFLTHKESARKLAEERIAHFNSLYKFDFQSIRIKNQKTRWGSCSRRGNLNFNYKIALLPEKIADYVIVHELCHLKELNHSKRFWELVSKAVPDYKEIRRSLRNNALQM